MSDELAERVTALEELVRTLVDRWDAGSPAAPAVTTSGPDTPSGPDRHPFWALDGLKAQVGDTSGAVLYTGTVTLPTGEHYDWQYGHTVDDLLDTDWRGYAETLTALAHPVRLLLIRQILAGTRTVAALAEIDGLGTTGQLYHHLRQLVSAGWLRSSARGQYAVPPERVVPLLIVLSGAYR
ncbi:MULTISPECIES: ArsR/SmtB family transcription factor [unclassified Solwaraspora]|uniref:ArsR/SmtB family transcription factor n=1 Tax=unclassified Solwaraspora TaxID=2627926 RepID=UPI00259B195A|nr:helix-turn-helix domain-containing protein [Solwaraspora sp. WMMA2056]WJK39960.1 helix-turn-helix domain-containing protein [Solwaraspora sp. WMMA2056]